MKTKANPIPGAQSSAKQQPQKEHREKSTLEAAQRAEGSFQPHNADKEALGPNTRR